MIVDRRAGSWASPFLARWAKEAPTCAETILRDFVAQARLPVLLSDHQLSVPPSFNQPNP